MCVCVCACVCVRERERENGNDHDTLYSSCSVFAVRNSFITLCGEFHVCLHIMGILQTTFAHFFSFYPYHFIVLVQHGVKRKILPSLEPPTHPTLEAHKKDGNPLWRNNPNLSQM